MKRITYAGESVYTSDDVGSVLVELTAATAKLGYAEAVVIPICDIDGGDHRTAELVIGVGNDVLAVPLKADEVGAEIDPDFRTEVDELVARLSKILPSAGPSSVVASEDAGAFNDYEMGLADIEHLGSAADPQA